MRSAAIIPTRISNRSVTSGSLLSLDIHILTIESAQSTRPSRSLGISDRKLWRGLRCDGKSLITRALSLSERRDWNCESLNVTRLDTYELKSEKKNGVSS